MTRWGLVGVLAVAAACGGKKEEGKPAAEANGPPTKAAKVGGDDAACAKVVEKVAEIYRAWDSGHAYGMMLDDKDGEHYQRIWRPCSRWSSAQDRACVIAAKDHAALEKCALLGDYRAMDDQRGVETCKGGVVDKLDCAGVWKDGIACVPAPEGYEVKGGGWDDGGEVELVYPDGNQIKLTWRTDLEDCEQGNGVREGKMLADAVHAECNWPSGAFAAYTEEGGERRARAKLCAASIQASCSVKGAPALEAACAGLQLVAKHGGATRYNMKNNNLDPELTKLDAELDAAMDALASAKTAEEVEAAKARVKELQARTDEANARPGKSGPKPKQADVSPDCPLGC